MKFPECSRWLLLPALLLLGVAGCRGVAPAAEDWSSDASRLDSGVAYVRPSMPAPTSGDTSADSPFGAILAGLFGTADGKSRKHVRLEPAPIVTERALGFGLTVHW